MLFATPPKETQGPSGPLFLVVKMNQKKAKMLRRNAKIVSAARGFFDDYQLIRKGNRIPAFNSPRTKRGVYKGYKKLFKAGVQIVDLSYEV